MNRPPENRDVADRNFRVLAQGAIFVPGRNFGSFWAVSKNNFVAIIFHFEAKWSL